MTITQEIGSTQIRRSVSMDVVKEDGHESLVRQKALHPVLPLSVSFLVTEGTQGDQILGRVIAEAAPRLHVMDLKIFCSPAALASPTVPL